MSSSRSPFLVLFALALGCEPSGGKPPGASDSDSGSSGSTGDSGTPGDGDSGEPLGAEGCRAEPREADGDRVVLANLPYEGTGTDWAVLRLTADGSLTDTGDTVAGGRSYLKPGVFTPDGSLGIAPLDDGTLAVFAVGEDGTVEVVETGFTTGFYADSVAMHPSGERVYVVDPNWADAGGGLYALDLDCSTGLPSVPTNLPVDSLGRLFPAKLGSTALPVPGRSDRIVLISGPGPSDVRLLDANAGTLLDETDAFLDPDDAWLATGAISPAGDLILLTDTSAWSERPNALAAVQLSGDRLAHAGLDELYDGVGLAFSPDGTTAIVSSGYGDDLLRLSLDAANADAVTVVGSLESAGEPVQLPGGMVTVQRGALAGTVLVAEVYGVRSVVLGPDGEAQDLGITGGRLVNPAGMLVQP